MQGAKVLAIANYDWTDFWLGVRDSIPLMLGIFPFGIACGLMGLTAGLTGGETILMSLLVFAGAAQFISITMLQAGSAGWGMIVFTTLLVNLRHLLMGASLAPYMLKLPISWQAILAFGMTDESYATTISRIQGQGYSPGYQMGANSADYLAWIIGTVIGVGLGSYVTDPLKWGLDFAMPATFLAILIPRLVDRKNLLVFLVGAGVALGCALYLPGKWYIIIACLAASLVGGLLEGERDSAR